MLTLLCGNLGSSKTTNAVRNMVKDNSGLPTYTNIKTKQIPNVHFYPNDKLVKKEELELKNGKVKEKYVFNRDFWLSLPKPMNIVWDEVHFMADSRESQSQMNKAVTEFISMARRIIGFDEFGYGDFTMIVQRIGTVDVRIRDLTTEVVYHILWWVFDCDGCGLKIRWNSEKPNLKFCLRCNQRKMRKTNYLTEKYHFKTVDDCNWWLITSEKRHYKKTHTMDIGNYFVYFDTLQYLKAEKKEV